jgi:magnesium transporter
VLRPARFLADEERVEVGELHVFTGPDFVVTVRHAETPDVAAIRARMEAEPALLALGPEAVLYAVLDQVVDEYQPVVDALEARIDATEAAMFAGEAGVSRRIQALFRELSLFHRALRPLPGMLRDLASGFDTYAVDQELRRLLRNVEDHVLRIAERVEGLRVLLQNTLAVNATLVAQAQNKEVRQLTEATFQQSEQVKRISSWAAILFAPTLIPTVYGMNFDEMPELGWTLGYPFALLLMALMYAVLYVVFRRRGWV